MNLQIDEYLATKYERQPSTKKTAARHLSYWDKWLDGRDLEAVGISDFEAWVDETRGVKSFSLIERRTPDFPQLLGLGGLECSILFRRKP